MALLELLAAPPGTGKTSHCIDLFRKKILESKAGMDAHAFFVLPSREHADRIQSLILKKEVTGLFNVHILTLNDLALRFVASSSASHPNDLLRKNLIKEILADPELDFGYFRDVKDLPGFHELLVDTVKEFKSSLLSVQDFEKRAQSLLVLPAFRSKFRDFSVVIKNYEKKLKDNGWQEPEAHIAALLASDEPLQAPRLVIFDGFYHFTRAQRLLLSRIARWSAHTVVTLTLPEKKGERPALFELTEKTRSFLLEEGFRQKKGFRENYRVADASLLHLEKNIFSDTPKEDPKPVKNIQIFEAASARHEVEMIAREIKRIHRERKLYHSDICVILRSIAPYEKLIYSVFSEFGIPVNVHERKKLIEQGLGRFLYRTLVLFTDGWKREDLLAILRSSYISGSPGNEILRFESESLSGNIRQGRESWLSLVTSSDFFSHIRTVLENLSNLEKELFSVKNSRAFTSILMKWIKSLDLREADQDVTLSIEALLKNFSRHWDAFLAGQNEFILRQLEEGIESALYSEKAAAKNCVQVYDVIMALPKEYKVVFMGGLLEKVFPQEVSEHALFKDEERRVFNREEEILEERHSRIAGERYFFYMGFTRARESLYLSYPLYSSQGQPTLPSFFVDEVTKCFKNPLQTVSRTLDKMLPAAEEWETPHEVTRGLARSLFAESLAKEATPGFFEMLGHWMERPDFQRVLAFSLRPSVAALSDASLRERFKSFNTFSATRLETFALCAYRYFAEQVMRLETPFEGREHLDMGKIMHRVLERYFLVLSPGERASKKLWEDEATVRKSMAALLEEEIGPYFQGEPLYRRRMFARKVMKLLESFIRREKKLLAQRTAQPSYFELSFGSKDAKLEPLKIRDESGDILIRGQIDRIDILDDGKALIVDYKKSTRSSSLDEKLKKGLELQLPIYLLVAKNLLKLEPAGAELRFVQNEKEQGVYRSSYAEKLGLHKSKKTHSDEEFVALLAAAEDTIRKYTKRMREADIRVQPKSCEFCHFDSVCRFEKWKLVYEGQVEA